AGIKVVRSGIRIPRLNAIIERPLGRPERPGESTRHARSFLGPTDKIGRGYSARMVDFTMLPDDLPVPVDDGAADHLPGTALPALTLPSTTGRHVDLGALGPGRTVIYLYPMTGRPGVELPAGWDDIPGARGCSTEACDFRDHFQDLRAAGARQVFGLS